MIESHPIAAVLGALFVLIVAYDGARTTLSASTSGPLTRRLSAALWRVLLFVHRLSPRHGMLERAGTWITLTLILSWVLIAWLGWGLLFLASPDAVLNSTTKIPASLIERIYFAGFTLTTLGVGDFVPGNGWARILTVVASANGLLLFTMSITYAIPIISAATEKRQLALTINTLGESPFDICRTTVGSGDFATLASQLEQIGSAIADAGQKHLAYPILHYFHSADTMTALPLALARLDQTLTIIDSAHQSLPDDTRARIAITRRNIAHFLGTLESAFIRPSARNPHIPALDDFIAFDFFGAPAQAVREQLMHTDHQKLLHAYVRDDGWRWEAVWHADNADEAATGDPDERR
ncbi:Ion transport 2 domain-containing protein [Salinisphaera shabanensis E1L3A]|uniref:Ion transport 2 domain-containing protein n=1 Tax=Salinisphaera shabanensis E1L3A TaxID=1033802 RepID=U2E7L4_9GAMM|nr:potassium channel family protein [Salinisphaera shabanensis]ERJ19726.1 Ion transport 2 domain-containing protein [Salinisphaera shabanensis E1L3A]